MCNVVQLERRRNTMHEFLKMLQDIDREVNTTQRHVKLHQALGLLNAQIQAVEIELAAERHASDGKEEAP